MPSPPSTRPIKPAKETHAKAPRKKTVNARISAACEACKKRKTKCTGGPPPCQLCVTLGTECVIDLSLDMRRRAAFQRTLDESRTYQDALNNLLDGIREGPSTRLEAMFELIRSGASNQEITNSLNQYSNRAEDKEGDDILSSQVDTSEPQVDGSKSPADTSSLGSVASESAKSKGLDTSMPIASLLTSLKNASSQEGEAILHQFLALRSEDRVGLPLWASEGRNLWEGFDAGISHPSFAERATWHPVLHLRSSSSRVEERPHMPPAARRFSEGGPKTEPTETISSDSPSPLSGLSRQSSRYPRITTDVPMSGLTVASSPVTPYFELVTNFPSAQPRLNEWDLCVAQEEDQVTRLRVPRHLVLPLVIPDDSPMSRTYTDYVHGARRMLESGVPFSDVLGPTEKVAVDLFFRPRRATDKFDCASWACEVSRSFDDDIFVRLASAYLLTHMMRWLLVPTLENYQKVPDMMKPTPAQCMVPHIGAIETIPLPPVRDAAINKLRDWLTPLIQAKWCVNWHDGLEAAVEQDLLAGATVLTQSFIEHVVIYDNWSVGSRFLATFPEVAGRIRIHELG